MRETQGRGGGETHKEGTEKRTTFGTDGRTDRRTDRGSYRSGAHLKSWLVNGIFQLIPHLYGSQILK